MGSHTKLMKKQQEQVHEKIMDGYRRGVCNKNGETIKVNGRPVAKPRLIRRVVGDPTQSDIRDIIMAANVH